MAPQRLQVYVVSLLTSEGTSEGASEAFCLVSTVAASETFSLLSLLSSEVSLRTLRRILRGIHGGALRGLGTCQKKRTS